MWSLSNIWNKESDHFPCFISYAKRKLSAHFLLYETRIVKIKIVIFFFHFPCFKTRKVITFRVLNEISGHFPCFKRRKVLTLCGLKPIKCLLSALFRPWYFGTYMLQIFGISFIARGSRRGAWFTLFSNFFFNAWVSWPLSQQQAIYRRHILHQHCNICRIM